MPALDEAQLDQAAAVRAALRRHLERRGGWVGFDEYLEQVLYAPGLGYYSAGAAKLGAAGDFITAPELSPLFGGCIARQCAPLLGAGRDLLELGAGSGALAEVLLTRLAELAALPDRYLILEPSADLRERQRTRLQRLSAELHQRVQWLDALPQRALRGVILANEVADALPFQCFAKRSDGFEELGVSLDHSGAPQWSARPASAALRGELERIDASLAQPFAAGFRGELCLRLEPWIAGLAGALESGAVLLFDYGLGRDELYHPQRDSGTLRCHFRHRAHDDPFLHPGCRTSRPGSISRDWRRPRPRRTSRSPATARRPRSCWVAASTRSWRAPAMRSSVRGWRVRRASCCCRARWARPSRPCCSRAAWCRRCPHSACRTCGDCCSERAG